MHFILKRITDFNVWLKTFKFELGIGDIHIIYLCWNKVLSGRNCNGKLSWFGRLLVEQLYCWQKMYYFFYVEVFFRQLLLFSGLKFNYRSKLIFSSPLPNLNIHSSPTFLSHDITHSRNIFIIYKCKCINISNP